MSRSHRFLALALVALAALLGIARLVEPERISVADGGPLAIESSRSSTTADPSVPLAPSGSDVAAIVASVPSSEPAPPPASVTPAGIADASCPGTGRSAVVDRASQRGALCDGGRVTYTFPLTSARSQPDPGTYDVYAKDLEASSNLSGEYSTMTHFVAFTRGKYQGARIAFHSVPTYPNGEYIQPLSSVGTLDYFGESAGCIRVLPDDAVRIWDWLSLGASVRVIT